MRRLASIFFAIFVVASVAVLAGVPEVVAGQEASYKQVVDNATEDRFEADDTWGTSSYGWGVKDSNYRFARPTNTPNVAQFKVEIPEAANYTVYARWPNVKGGNGSAPVGVATTSGMQWTWVDQQRDGGRWVRIGVFEMQAGDDYSVMFSRETSGEGYVIADAVKVEWQSPADASPDPPESEEAGPRTEDENAETFESAVARAAESERSGSSEDEGGRISSESKAPQSKSGQEVVKEARKWIGVRYQLGGQTRRGVDCSGFTMMVYKRFGVSLPHWDDKQYRMGTKVPEGQEKPGDLVFFDEYGDGTISHEGIYAGNGKIIHASDHFGETTESDMKYIKGYVGARRLL